MKIKMLTQSASPSLGAFRVGQVVDLKPEDALPLLEGGFAVLVEAEKAVAPEPEKAEVPPLEVAEAPADETETAEATEGAKRKKK